LKVQIYERIADVPASAWDALLGGATRALDRAFWQVLERARLNDFEYRYALFTDDGGAPLALTSLYSVTTDIAIFAPAPLRAVLGAVRRVWPGFLKLRMLECGTPVTISSPPWAKRADVDDAAFIGELDALLRRTARAEGQLFIIVRDFEPNAAGLRPLWRARGYHWIPSLPNTYMDIRWDTPKQYLASMRSYHRSKLLKHRKRNADIRHERVDDFGHLADTLCRQWMVVHESAREFQREVLTPEFYRRLSSDLGADSKALLFYRGEALVGHALLLLDGDMLRWLYVGREVAGNDGLYLYVAHAVVDSAIELGAKCLELGLTTYAIKQDLGAEVVPIHIALRASWGLINPFVGLGYALLNSVPRPTPRQVFKSAAG
jgi:hypothetical protein